MTQVDVWHGSLVVSSEKLAELKNILSSDELARSDRFKFAIHRDRYIVARAYLRCFLADYTGIPAPEICFTYSDRGKPAIANLAFTSSRTSSASLHFNLSHSEDLAIYCFATSYLVGVDLEYLLKKIDCDRIAERFFSQQEAKLIQNLPEKQKKQTFFQLWTAKEAYLKATGEGLVGGLDNVEIAIDSLGKSKIITINKQKNTNHNWYLHCFQPQVNFLATVATQKQPENLSIQELEPDTFPRVK